jgi:hypothetical protein
VTVLTFNPETVGMQIRQETTSCFIMSMGYVVTGDWAFSSDLTYSRHCNYSKQTNMINEGPFSFRDLRILSR